MTQPHLHKLFKVSPLGVGGLLLFISLTITAAPQLSRHYTYRYFSTRDGLAQMQLMCAYQDKDGFIWFGTKGGVSRWDGKSFRNYTPEDGLPLGETVNISECGSRKLIFSSRKMAILEQNDSLSVVNLPEGKIQPGLWSHIIAIDNDNVFFLGLIDEFNDAQNLSGFNYSFNFRTRKFRLLKGFDKFAIRTFDNYVVTTDGLYHWTGKVFAQVLRFPYSVSNAIFDKNFKQCALEPFNLDKQQLFSIKNGTFTALKNATFEGSVGRSTWLTDGSYLSLYYKDYYFYPPRSIRLFDNFTYPNFSLVDKENNLWIGTENGLYNFFNLNIEEYNFNLGTPDNIWSVMEDNAGKMWFGSYGNGLYTLDKNEKLSWVDFSKYYTGAKKMANMLLYMGCTKADNGTLFITNSNGVARFVNGKFRNESDTRACLYAYFDKQTDNIYYSGMDTLTQKRGLYVGMNKDKKFYPFPKGFPISIIRDGNGVIRVGAFRGTGILKNEKLIVDTLKRNYVSVVSMALDKQKRLWKATEKGIFVELRDGREFRISPLQLTGSYTSLLVNKNKYLIAGGTLGFAIIDISISDNYDNPTIVNVGYEGGFTGLESGQNGICMDSEGYVWLTTALNVLRFHPEEIIKNHQQYLPTVSINSISFSSDNINWKRHFFDYGVAKIAFENKFFRIDYISNSISAPKSLRFRYRLVGLSDKWSEVVYSKSVNYTNIGFGKYRFEVQCSMNGTDWSPVVKSPVIEITVPFYMRPIAYFAYFVLIIMLSVYITRYFARQKQAKQLQEQSRKKLENELQLKTLRSKIIPHFTKNVLSAIGHFAMTERLKAGHYIAVFYKFTEKTLHFADKNYIALADEIEYTKLYLELEKMRFEDKNFYFEIKITPEIDPKMLVPALTLHTYCDNAIRHGLINKPLKGWKLIIDVEKTAAGVKISVTDNGIGRKNAAQLGTQGAGQGLALIEQQLNFYNSRNTEKIRQEIVDLSDSEGKATGTKIELYIPDNYKFAPHP